MSKSNLDILYDKSTILSDKKLTLELCIKFLEIDRVHLLRTKSDFEIHENLKELSKEKKMLEDNICEQSNVSEQIKRILALKSWANNLKNGFVACELAKKYNFVCL